MKIGVIITHCKNNKASRYVIEVSKYFVENHEVHVFTHDWDPMDEKVIIHRIPMFSQFSSTRHATFTLLSSMITKRYPLDIRLSQPTRYFSPNVCEMQVIYKEWAKAMNKKNLSIRMITAMEGYNIKKAKKIIAISGRVKNDILRNYPFVVEEDVHVVYSGVDLNKFTPQNKEKYFKEIRKRHKISSSDLVLLFVGNPFSLKGLEPTIKALIRIMTKNYRLLICGRDNPTYYQLLARKLGVDEKVIFTGFRSDMHKYFAASDIFVFPTLYDAFGLVALEAMASGLPVISSEAAGISEIIDDEKDGLKLKNPKDHEEIAKKLNFFIENDKLRKTMGKNARKKAEKYSWEVTAKKMLNVFEEVMKG